MKIIVPNNKVELDDLSDLRSPRADKSVSRVTGSGLKKGDEKSPNKDALTVELAALDAIVLPQKEVARIHNLSQPSVHNYSEGKKTGDGPVNPDLQTTILDNKYKIQNKAVTKLMETLDLFDPNGFEDQNELINGAAKLAGIVDKIGGTNKDNKPVVQLVMYQPRLRNSKDFEVIEVG